jgi:hypothetical protein
MRLQEEDKLFNDYLNNRVDPAQVGEDKAIFLTLQLAAGGTIVSENPGVLTLDHIIVPSVKNSAFCREWINYVFYLEKKRLEITKKDPKKGIRTKEEEWSSLIEKGLWNVIIAEAKVKNLRYNKEYVNLFVVKRILEKIQRKVVENRVDPISYEAVKHVASKWNDLAQPHDAFLSVHTELRQCIEDANQRVTDDFELQLLFSLMPEKFARYLLQALLDIPMRGYGLGQSDTPMDKLRTSKEDFEYLVHNSGLLVELMFQQLEYYGKDFNKNFDPDNLKIMTGITKFPNKDLFNMLKHLVPIAKSVGATKEKIEGIEIRQTGVYI